MNGIVMFIVEKLPISRKIWNFFDGWKEYIAGAGMMFSGLAGCLGILAMWATQLAALKDMAAMIAWVEGLKHDPASAAFIVAWAGFLQGLKYIGARHAAEKSMAALTLPSEPIVLPELIPPAKVEAPAPVGALMMDGAAIPAPEAPPPSAMAKPNVPPNFR